MPLLVGSLPCTEILDLPLKNTLAYFGPPAVTKKKNIYQINNGFETLLARRYKTFFDL
jgi:hypothetical protein